MEMAEERRSVGLRWGVLALALVILPLPAIAAQGQPGEPVGRGKTLPTGWCGVRRAHARFRDTAATLATRHGLTLAEFVALNELADGEKLVHRRRYVIARGFVGEHLEGGRSIGPSTDAYLVPNPDRSWGRPHVVEALQAAARRVRKELPGGQRVVIEDISLPRGGCLTPHIEHRGGLEVDAGLYHKGTGKVRGLMVATRANLDVRRTWRFLRSVIDTGQVRAILLDVKVQRLLAAEARRQGTRKAELGALFNLRRGTRKALFKHAGGHANHAHIKFHCPGGDCSTFDYNDAATTET